MGRASTAATNVCRDKLRPNDSRNDHHGSRASRYHRLGARFTASERAFGSILQETAKRGRIFVDDGPNPRSVAARIAGGSNLPFATDRVADAVATPTEIDHGRGRLEMAARERGFAIGMASALPVSIERIAKWEKAAESRGLQLVPITAVASKAKQS